MGRFDLAISNYDMAIDIAPYHPIAYANRAIANAIMGNNEEANRDIDQAAELGLDRSLLEADIATIMNQQVP